MYTKKNRKKDILYIYIYIKMLFTYSRDIVIFALADQT